MKVEPYVGENPLYQHGAIKVASNKRHFVHSDGKPFLWLGDTWWMGFCKRLEWPNDFLTLVTDRVEKGFSVIQIVAGLYPDMPPFDERGLNEAGYVWEKDYERINPEYFDLADERIKCLVENGLMPCIVGCWGYFVLQMGVEKMKKHWRNIIARWGAYPVTWCLAGEGSMPYYLSKTPDEDTPAQIEAWYEVGKYVRETDSFSRLVTIHPPDKGRDQVSDDSVLDFDMLQTGHCGIQTVGQNAQNFIDEYNREPTMPVLDGEANYEGILHCTTDEMQRLEFWSFMLLGAAGHTYGANGIWQVNTRKEKYGASPHGGTWGNQPWEDAYQWPGSKQLALGKKLLEEFDWWRFEPHQEWCEPSADKDDYFAAYAAGIPGEIRVIYMYWPTLTWTDKREKVAHLEPDVSYEAFYFDPRTGEKYELGVVEADEDNSWLIPIQPTLHDWVLVLKKAK